ncbi:GNAT family N-acetyltransferase [Streptomyces sp. NBC_01622]|uniref:GNAT family N-acetyltransferase n=1 Tax=Streptomyces sp. NBC_01622 TaxID=2975903 RepID=UPI003864E841|nr:GNAT family N-acetyltransferase [Streptomyces sp. NBC_01622]
MPLNPDRMPLCIRSAVENDLPALASLDAEAFPMEPYPFFVLRQLFDVYRDHLLVVDDGHLLYGYLIATPPDAGLSWILSLGVTRGLRGHGLGRRLMVQSLGQLRSEHAHEVRLTVAPDNDRAVSLYEHLGFTQTGDVQKDYLGPGKHRILMTLELPDSAAPPRETPPSAPSATVKSGRTDGPRRSW